MSPKSQHTARGRKAPTWESKDYISLANSRDIRLLILEPGDGPDIHCSLRNVSLDDEEAKFEALSYVWGTIGTRSPWHSHWMCFVYLDGKKMDITANAYKALQQLRLSDQTRTLWVDAICINQIDNQERNQQVKLMRYIYSKADQVLVYLNCIGRVNKHRQMSTITSASSTGTTARSRTSARYYEPFSYQASIVSAFVSLAWQQNDPQAWLESTLGKQEFVKYWSGVSAMFASPYWSRIWIIQEIGMSRNIVVIYGKANFDWDVVCRLHRVWKEFLNSSATWSNSVLMGWTLQVQSSSLRPLARIITKHVPIMKDAKNLAINRFLRQQPGPWDIDQNIKVKRVESDLNVLHLLASHFTSFSTDPRDKIYGLVGLLDDYTASAYHINYSAEVPKTLEYLVQYMLESTGSLDVICYASFHKGLPSWVPFWGPSTNYNVDMLGSIPFVTSSRLWRRLPLHFYKHRPDYFTPVRDGLNAYLRRMMNEENFNAARGTQAEAHIEEADRRRSVLIARGCILDEISDSLYDLMPPKRKKYGTSPKAWQLLPDYAEYAPMLESSSEWLQVEPYISLSDQIKRLLTEFLRTKSPIRGPMKLQAFLQTITYGRTTSGEAAGLSWWDSFQTLLRNGSPDTNPTPRPSTSSELERSRQTVCTLLDRYHEVSREVFAGGLPLGEIPMIRRKVYVTKGGSIGLGEGPASKGDLVCVLKGCPRPILVKRVRIRSNSHQEEGVIDGVSHGCTYFHGYMDGRAIDEIDSGSLQPCTFRLH